MFKKPPLEKEVFKEASNRKRSYVFPWMFFRANGEKEEKSSKIKIDQKSKKCKNHLVL